MGDGEPTHQDLETTLTRYLQSWGLREFHDEGAYYEWQRETLSPQDLELLQSLVAQRQGGENEQADIQFYDLLANPSVLPIIYSQRFDYFRQIGLCFTPRLSSVEHVLDFGCGVGILTCFFAKQYPEIQFVGIDRSPRAIDMAQQEAKQRGIPNVWFRGSQEMIDSSDDFFDCILSTQALFQSECEPGLPSRNWQTFERGNNFSSQEQLETRTGLGRRLELLLSVLSPTGRLLCFEKTWNLGRRIFFQRALNAKKLFPICDPVPISYHELGESVIDGPLFEVSRILLPETYVWNEAPYFSRGETLYRCVGVLAERMGNGLDITHFREMIAGQHDAYGEWTFSFGVWEEALAWGWCETSSGFRGLLLASAKEASVMVRLVEKVRVLTDLEFEEFIRNGWGAAENIREDNSPPGYENHFPSAAGIYEALPQKVIQQEATFVDGQGREMHIEIGTTNMFHYLYWANTFDQRQLLLIDEKGASILDEYYCESLVGTRDSSQEIPPRS